ncbi:MAG: hypothetical protein HDT23_00610 [Ruminococcus sp.]|nr:hypothetical protein [Ruminococcus sp.]
MTDSINSLIMFVSLAVLINAVIWGLITKTISRNKGYKGGFWWGFWLNIIGVIVVACRPNNNNNNN